MTNKIANIGNVPRVDFRPDEFNDKILEKGYEINWHRYIICPCRKDLTSQANTNCINCNGTGNFYLPEIKTFAMISSASLQKNFIQWTENLQGTANISIDSEYKIGFMDKIEILNAETIFSEVRKLEVNNSIKEIKTFYKALKIIKAYKFENESVALYDIDLDDISIIDKKLIIIDPAISETDSISILYEYNPTYFILDILNDYRNTKIKNGLPFEELRKMPLRAIMKKAHLIQ
jgi:hypothetical protein